MNPLQNKRRDIERILDLRSFDEIAYDEAVDAIVKLAEKEPHCPKCENDAYPSVNFKDGKPYVYCCECGFIEKDGEA